MDHSGLNYQGLITVDFNLLMLLIVFVDGDLWPFMHCAERRLVFFLRKDCLSSFSLKGLRRRLLTERPSVDLHREALDSQEPEELKADHDRRLFYRATIINLVIN